MDFISTLPPQLMAVGIIDRSSPHGDRMIRTRTGGRKNHGSQEEHQDGAGPATSKDTHCGSTEGGDGDVSMAEHPGITRTGGHPTLRSQALSWEQSCKRVQEENQEDDDDGLEAWHVPALPFGGRIGHSAPGFMDTGPALIQHPSSGERTLGCADGHSAETHGTHFPEAASVAPCRGVGSYTADPTAAMEAWLNTAPFTRPPPPALLTAVQEELRLANQAHSRECAGILPGWKDMHRQKQSSEHGSPIEEPTTATDETLWTVQPDEKWFLQSIAQRPGIGRSLLQRALGQDRTASSPATSTDIWATPFRVGYLNIGYRRFRISLETVVALVKLHRPDILFLGDMGCSRAGVGRLRQRLTAELDDEWFLWTDISASPGYPIGMGAIIHCSLDQYIKKLDLPCPPEANNSIWSRAVEGRLMQLEICRPEFRRPWRYIGIYQHVARRAPKYDSGEDLVRRTLTCILQEAKADTHQVLLLGDVNSAPLDGRWGYSYLSPVLQQVDLEMTRWIAAAGLVELTSNPRQATWRPNLQHKRAILDRAFVYPNEAQTARLQVSWCKSSTMFDHAIILVTLPPSTAGFGFAGACPPTMTRSRSGGQINLQKWNQPQCREEWARILQTCLAIEEAEELQPSQDPYQSLKMAEGLAVDIARRLAPKLSGQPGGTKRSFCFPGHKVICRELDNLQHARRLVQQVLSQVSELMECPHRLYRWMKAQRRVNQTWRSGLPAVSPLCRDPAWYFTPAARQELQEWVGQAKSAIDARWATMREDFERAHRYNLQNARMLLMKKGHLDQRTLRSALGVRQPRRRMFELSGKVAVGVRLGEHEQEELVLTTLTRLPAVEKAVKLCGASAGLQIWFRGPQALGDFLVAWCALAESRSISMTTLCTCHEYLAVTPEDMLSIQELHLSSEGMDTASICLYCRKPGLQPISTTAAHQQFGNPQRAIRFLCTRCRRVMDQVDLLPLPPCPLPPQVQESMRRIPLGTAPLIARPLDYDALVSIVKQLLYGKMPGCDLFPRELYRHAPPPLLMRLLAAINAFIEGKDPTVNPEEWRGALISLLPKTPAAIQMPANRPVGMPCAKFVIFSKALDRNLRRALEEYKILAEEQEGFRSDRNTQRQIKKLQCLLDNARERNTLTVRLYLDIRNAFNAINHRAMLHILRAYGFPDKDVDLFHRMYQDTFLVVANQFGLSAACTLLRGVLQGAPTSPNVFITAFNPVHTIVQTCKRGCVPWAGAEPMGSSGFADDTTLHTDGPDAVPAMQVLVDSITPYMDWLGLLLNMGKCRISAIDHATGEPVSTDSIRYKGVPFPVLPPNEAHKVVGVFMNLTGDYKHHKDYVLAKMRQRAAALAEEEIIPRGSFRELAVTSGIISIFRASAGVIPWTGAELDEISKLWTKAFKKAWEFPASMDGSPIISPRGGRRCPSARKVWIEDTLRVWDQCMQLPGDISTLVLTRLRASCRDRGCKSFSQLQKVLRVDGSAESIPELLALRLDEQGLELSTPWPQDPGQQILAVLWPQVATAWRNKLKWRGCTELSEEMQEQWAQAQFRLKMCYKLGRCGILFLEQLQRGSSARTSWEALHRLHCSITRLEYSQLLSILAPNWTHPPHEEPGQRIIAPGRLLSSPTESVTGILPPCITGRVLSVPSAGQLELGHHSVDGLSDMAVDSLSDSQLLVHLCKTRAVLYYTTDGVSYVEVECLTPLSRVWKNSGQQESAIVLSLDPTASQKLGVFGVSLIRDLLKDKEADQLSEACSRPPWRVSRTELSVWFPHLSQTGSGVALPDQQRWQFQPYGSAGMQQMIGLTQGIQRRRDPAPARHFLSTCVWQTDPPLPTNVSIDLSNHIPKLLPAPSGWEVQLRNARVLITDPRSHTFAIDGAQYGMLLGLQAQGRNETARGFSSMPTVQFLSELLCVCRLQRRNDSVFGVPWNRHFIACIQHLTQADLLIGPSVATHNPHFSFLVSLTFDQRPERREGLARSQSLASARLDSAGASRSVASEGGPTPTAGLDSSHASPV